MFQSSNVCSLLMDWWWLLLCAGVFIAKGDVGVGTIVGSAVFNILFVIGICGVFVTQVRSHNARASLSDRLVDQCKDSLRVYRLHHVNYVALKNSPCCWNCICCLQAGSSLTTWLPAILLRVRNMLTRELFSMRKMHWSCGSCKHTCCLSCSLDL